MTLDKNLLGVITFVLSLGTVWRVLGLFWADERPPTAAGICWHKGRCLPWGLAVDRRQFSYLSRLLHLGAGLLLATNLRFIRRHPAAVHVLVLSLAVTAGLVILLGGRASVAQALGRDPTSPGVRTSGRRLYQWPPTRWWERGSKASGSIRVYTRLGGHVPGPPLNEAHDGYIEMYLELGWLGLSLIGLY